MSARDLLLVVVAVVGSLSLVALAIVLVRTLAALGQLRRLIAELRHEIRPLLIDLRSSTDEARSAVTEASRDLERFDRVLGSAEAISDAVAGSGHAARTALSRPVIKVAAVASGTRRAVRRLRGRPMSLETSTGRRTNVVPIRRRRSAR